MAFRRGYQAELELVDFLTRNGFYAVRAPVSGGRGFPEIQIRCLGPTHYEALEDHSNVNGKELHRRLETLESHVLPSTR